MIDSADIVITAWDGDRLVGFARALSDFSWAAYISEVAVHPDYQRQHIGFELIHRICATSSETRYILRALEGTEEFYRQLGFQPLANGFLKLAQL